MGDDEGEYVESFVQADDSALMAAIQARDAAVMPLLKCAQLFFPPRGASVG
jgi:hypothetical protein